MQTSKVHFKFKFQDVFIVKIYVILLYTYHDVSKIYQISNNRL